MHLFKKFYMPLPGTDDEKGNNKNEDDVNKTTDDKNKTEQGKDEIVHKSKLQDALQQWANDDARDIAEDDSTPLRSGL